MLITRSTNIRIVFSKTPKQCTVNWAAVKEFVTKELTLTQDIHSETSQWEQTTALQTVTLQPYSVLNCLCYTRSMHLQFYLLPYYIQCLVPPAWDRLSSQMTDTEWKEQPWILLPIQVINENHPAVLWLCDSPNRM